MRIIRMLASSGVIAIAMAGCGKDNTSEPVRLILEVHPPSAALSRSSRLVPTGSVIDSRGTLIDGTPTLQFTSGDTTIVRVAGDTLIAERIGTTTVIARTTTQGIALSRSLDVNVFAP
jgi:hypothetical protein